MEASKNELTHNNVRTKIPAEDEGTATEWLDPLE